MKFLLAFTACAAVACACHAQSPVSPMQQVGASDHMDSNTLARLAKPGDTVLAMAVSSTSPAIGVLVTYRPDNEGGPACPVIVFDLSNEAPEEVAHGDKIIGCADADPEAAAKQIHIDVDAARIALERAKGNSSELFEIRREGPNQWRVAEVTYTAPETDASTGDVIVVQQKAEFNGVGPTLGEFSYTRIEPNLVRTEIR